MAKRYGWNGPRAIVYSMPSDYYIDFSYSKRSLNNTYCFDIPDGFNGMNLNHCNKVSVWSLQHEHGCANVFSGAAMADRNKLGIYYGDNEGAHRPEISFDGPPMCRCFG